MCTWTRLEKAMCSISSSSYTIILVLQQSLEMLISVEKKNNMVCHALKIYSHLIANHVHDTRTGNQDAFILALSLLQSKGV